VLPFHHAYIHPWRPTGKLRNFHGWIAGIPGYLTHKPTMKNSAWKIAESAEISLKMPLPTDAENCRHCRGICCAVYTMDKGYMDCDFVCAIVGFHAATTPEDF
jgi:hypothetical protein